jgi:transcriptional regulator with XRE-family HTH domain
MRHRLGEARVTTDRCLELFAANVERLLTEKKMSARELARRAEDLDPSQLNKWLKKKQMPELRVLTRLAKALAVSPAELLMTEEERSELDLARRVIERARGEVAIAPPAETAPGHPSRAVILYGPELGGLIEKFAAAKSPEEAQSVLEQIQKRFGTKAQKKA